MLLHQNLPPELTRQQLKSLLRSPAHPHLHPSALYPSPVTKTEPTPAPDSCTLQTPVTVMRADTLPPGQALNLTAAKRRLALHSDEPRHPNPTVPTTMRVPFDAAAYSYEGPHLHHHVGFPGQPYSVLIPLQLQSARRLGLQGAPLPLLTAAAVQF